MSTSDLVIMRLDAYTDGRPCYVAEDPALPGCVAYGDTMDEARMLLQEARRVYLRALEAEGAEPPAPQEGNVDLSPHWRTGEELHGELLTAP